MTGVQTCALPICQSVADPVVPFRVNWSTAEVKDLGLKFPRYSDQLRQVVQQQVAATGTRFLFSAINPGLQNPYAMHYQFNIQRAITSTLMVESGYVGNRGVKFILHRTPNLPDRNTGIRPNTKLVFGGYYVDNSQNTSYNAWQTSVRKRFSHGFSYDGHYTFSKTLGVSGAVIGAVIRANITTGNTQCLAKSVVSIIGKPKGRSRPQWWRCDAPHGCRLDLRSATFYWSKPADAQCFGGLGSKWYFQRT